MLSLSSDAALVPKEPAPAPKPNPSRDLHCPLCWAREPEAHTCKALGGSEVILAVGYADSEMRLLLVP